MQFISKSIQDTVGIGIILGECVCAGDIIAFTGTLATGKTCFTKGLALGLNIKEEITSPTFTILSEYYGRLPLYHFDLYGSFDDFLDIAGDEYLYGNGVCVIEWSEKILTDLPKNTIRINIELMENDFRKITIENCPSKYLEHIKHTFRDE